MQEFHNKTDITLKNSFEQNQFIDWRTQAKNYKSYPNFFRRFNIDEYEELKFIKNFGKITQTKTYGNETLNLRVNPSAGGLYPCEIYIQIRGVKALLPGIYHYEPLSNSLVLIHELSLDGIELYFNNSSQQKFIFLISNVYFRSSWKYEKRAIRYLLLDTGHQLASMYVALKLANIEHTISFNFDKNFLNNLFSFDKFEFFMASIISKESKEKKTKSLRENIVFAPACDYYKKDTFFENFYKKLYQEKVDDFPNFNLLDDISKNNLEKIIDKRRSIRAFKGEAISKEQFEFITKSIFDFVQDYGLEIFFINNNITNMKKGIYKKAHLLEEGDFKELCQTLCFNQKLGKDSAFILFYTSTKTSNYLQNSILSSFLAHIISLRAKSLDIDSSGIGAYFDDESQRVLKTKNNILYLQVIGK